MVLDIPPTMYFAQVYDCSTYGAAAYNECPATTDTPSGGTASPSVLSNPNSPNTTAATVEETTPETQPTPAPSRPNTTEEAKNIELITPANTIAAMDWMAIVPLALVISVLFGLIILLFTRHRRKQMAQF